MLLPLEVVVGTEILALILSGGTAAMVLAVVQAYRSLKDGSRADDRDAFAELEDSRTNEKARADQAERERDYWHNRAATLEYVVITKNGPEALPPKEPFPEPPGLRPDQSGEKN